MDNKKVAKQLVRIAKELVQPKVARNKSLRAIIDNAERLLESGGRGLELGIRDVKWLAEESERVHKEMRKAQNNADFDAEGQEQLQDTLLALFVGA